MDQYMLVGISLALISGGLAVVLAVWTIQNHNRLRLPAYQRKLPDVLYGEADRELLLSSYETAGSIDGMLAIAMSQTASKKIKKRLAAAGSYLKESRYKDYETALCFYAADGTKETESLFRKIIEREVIKRRGLPVFQQEVQYEKK